MENPDVVLEVSEKDGAMQLAYKVYNRKEDDDKSAIEFGLIMQAICGYCEEE